MSRLRPGAENGSKRITFHEWLDGDSDPLLGKVEMKPQHEYMEDEDVIIEREKDYGKIRDSLYDINKNIEVKIFKRMYVVLSIVFFLILVIVLLDMVSHLPRMGYYANPNNNEVAKRYIERGLDETGAINIVTGMILDYRAFDTFGESNVLFIATIAVLILLRVDKVHKEGKELTIEEAEENDRIYEPKNDIILQKIASILVPLIILFGIYVILNGHISPGGGFSGGAIVGAGLILYLNAFGFAKTERFFTEKTYKGICCFALSFYAIAKSYSFYMGANHMESNIPLGIPGAILSSGLILPLNMCVGLVVACTMYAFYVMFRKGGF